MEERRKSMHRDVIADLGQSGNFLKSSIPYSSEIEKMGIYREPVNAHRPNSAAAQSYRKLWEEIRQQL